MQLFHFRSPIDRVLHRRLIFGIVSLRKNPYRTESARLFLSARVIKLLKAFANLVETLDRFSVTCAKLYLGSTNATQIYSSSF